MNSIDINEASTHFPRLLGRVKSGESFAIYRHGEVIAHLVPPLRKASTTNLGKMIAQWKRTRKGVHLDGLNVRNLINEGRQ